MKLIYVAGKYSAPTAWETKQNIRRAEEAAVEIWRAGAACLCPHANTAFMDGVTTYDNFIAGCFRMMEGCDAALFLPKWEESRGANMEMEFCVRNDIPWFLDMEGERGLRAWLAGKDREGLPGEGQVTHGRRLV